MPRRNWRSPGGGFSSWSRRRRSAVIRNWPAAGSSGSRNATASSRPTGATGSWPARGRCSPRRRRRASSLRRSTGWAARRCVPMSLRAYSCRTGQRLRREGRRVDAREQLRTAHDMLAAMGMDAFAERAQRELVATGERLRKRSVETVATLTAQVGESPSSRGTVDQPEIGTRLFLSARTVEWHLRKIFTKLGISSRRELRAALAQSGGDRQPAVAEARPGMPRRQRRTRRDAGTGSRAPSRGRSSAARPGPGRASR